jgi:SsrA-binding protein
MVPPGAKVVATNRQARRNYDVLDTFEAGLVLKGSEVKSLRESKVTLADAYARIIGREAWVVGLHITPYSHAGTGFGELDPERDRKLLLHRTEIDRLRARIDQDRLTLVPLSLYFKDGRAKLELGLAKGRTGVDKRQVMAKRDAEREAERAMAQARRRADPS